MLGPGRSPVGEKVGAVPVTDLAAEPFGTGFAHRQHHMGVGLGLAVRAHVPMDVEVGDHAVIDEPALHEVPRQGDPLGLIQLSRDRELDLAGELGVLAFLDALDLIPERLAILPALGRASRRHHLGVDDAGLVGEIVVPSEPLIV